jgi:hypothetical protein
MWGFSLFYLRQDFENFEDEQLGFWVHMILNSYESMVEFHQILFDDKVCKNGIIGIPMHFG